jgi:Skp family chaperone for outer membrane proteins
MKSGTSWAAVLVTAAVVWMVSATLSAARNDAPAAASPAGTKVGVVDLVRVFNDFKQTKALNQKMQDYRNKLGEQKDKRQQEINAERAALDAFSPDSADWFKRNEELKKKRFEFEIWQAMESDALTEHHLRWVKRTYESVTKEIADVAKQRGLQLVVTREEMDTPSTNDTSKILQATFQQILNRKVVYSDSNIDVSDEVLANLNAGFEKAGGDKVIDVTK